MSQDLQFVQSCSSMNGTCFLCYLYLSHTDVHTHNDINLSFPEIIGRLYSLCDYDIFEDQYEKTSFEVFGIYKGEVFTLYDYKGDYNIHIGGHKDKLDINGLVRALADTIMKTQPRAYKAHIEWTGDTYAFP